MEKNDLKNGMVVETKNGNIYLVLKPFRDSEFILINNKGYLEAIYYYDNLQRTSLPEYSIVKIYKPTMYETCEFLKEKLEINLSNFELMGKDKILDKLNSIQNQLNEVKNMVL
jgi:hypothetical protein